ncbi:MAG: hypothetical protein R6U04_12895 [Bacteroidales bacterium]
MNEKMKKLIDESIQLEHNMAELYERFAKLYPEDKIFWRELVLEEKNHAAILRAGKESFLDTDFFPESMLAGTYEEVHKVNQQLNRLIKSFENRPMKKESTFNIAYKLEKSAGEIHFQEYMDKKPAVEIDRVFQQLNRDDKDHAERILNYMEQNDIPHTDEMLPE